MMENDVFIFQFSVPELNIFLINTNVPRSTKTMVAGLRHRYEEVLAQSRYIHSWNWPS